MTEALVTFKPNGTLSASDRAYVERRFETQVWSSLTANEWVSLLGPRKYGKSSALVRIRDRLLAGGYACAFVDVQGYGRSRESYADFLEWFAEELATEMGSSFAAPRKRNRTAVEAWLQAVVPRDSQNTAILIDEASGVPAAFRTTFFGQLRAFYNSRGRGGLSGQLAKRVVFVFSGTFRPVRMISGDNSPFDISQESNPEDFTESEVVELARLGLDGDSEQFARRAYEETRGQPFYVQYLFAAAQAAQDDRQAAFDAALGELRAGAHGHLEHLTTLIKTDDELRALVPRIRAGDLRFRGGDSIHQYALVSGIARIDGDRLVPRNAIHALALDQFPDPSASTTRFP